MRVLATMAIVALALAFPPGAHASEAAVSQVTAGGSGEVHVPPTRATFTVTIETASPASATAASENARITKDVTTALLGAGVTHGELKASRLNVNAVWDYPKSGERRRRGYTATNTLQIDTKQLDRLGTFIDTSLEAGATAVTSPNFSSDDRAVARHQALALAVAAARDDAETIAKAAGGALGDLLEASTDGAVYAGAPSPMTAMSRAAGAATEVISSDIAVSAHVNMRWAFTPNRR